MKQKTQKTINQWRLTNFHLGPTLHPKGFRVFSVSFQVFRPRRRGSPGCRRRTKTSAWWMPFILSWRVIEPYFRGGIGPCLRLWMLISPKSFCYCLSNRKRPHSEKPVQYSTKNKRIQINSSKSSRHRSLTVYRTASLKKLAINNRNCWIEINDSLCMYVS